MGGFGSKRERKETQRGDAVIGKSRNVAVFGWLLESATALPDVVTTLVYYILPS